jgi:hypothetical protein
MIDIDVQNIRKKVNEDLLTKKLQLQRLEDEKATLELLERKHENALAAQALLNHVSNQTKASVKAKIEGIISAALTAVFPDPYAFELDFIPRRGKTECDIYFVRNGERISPVESSGGGALDVASFAARIAFWSLNRTRPVFLLDEPFKFLSADFRPLAGEMMKTLSKKFGIQIIMVTHLPELLNSADKIFDLENITWRNKHLKTS